MKKTKPEIYTKAEKLLFDWRDMKNFLVNYRMLKFSVRHGMVVEKIHERISFKQISWLEKGINFNTQKRIKGKIDFEKDFCKLLNNECFGKTMETVKNRFG